MFSLFRNIFGQSDKHGATHPESLVTAVIERSLDETDARVRILPAYAKKMRPAAVHTIDHIIQMIESLSPPLPFSRGDWSQQVVLGAMFASGDRIREILLHDHACIDYREANPVISEPVTALLLAECTEKKIFGVDLINDRVMSDIPLTVVSFDNHRLQCFASSEAETRRQLRLRAFDFLQTLVLANITEAQEKREDLVVRKKLLQAKLGVLSSSSGNLSSEPRVADRQALQERLAQIEAELANIGADDSVLQQHLDIIIGMLGAAETQLWIENRTLYIDNLHILRSADHEKAQAIPLQVLKCIDGRQMAVQLVTLPPGVFV